MERQHRRRIRHIQGTDPARTGARAEISGAAANADFPHLAAAILVMSVLVVAFNRTVWRWCYRLAEERFSLSK